MSSCRWRDTSDAPKEVGVFILVCFEDPAIRDHNCNFHQIVNRKPVLSRQISVSATKNQSPYACMIDCSSDTYKTLRGGRVIEICPQRAALSIREAFLGVNADVAQVG
jgi:hypothetical protein